MRAGYAKLDNYASCLVGQVSIFDRLLSVAISHDRSQSNREHECCPWILTGRVRPLVRRLHTL
jgi:hypothetical protein